MPLNHILLKIKRIKVRVYIIDISASRKNSREGHVFGPNAPEVRLARFT